MTEDICLAVPSESVEDARRLYLEQYGSVLVLNAHLRVALLALSCVVVGLLMLTARAVHLAHDSRPLVVRIDQMGRAEAVADAVDAYQPQTPEIRYFLVQFVTHYYARRRATVKDDIATALAFLDGHLAEGVMASERRSHALETSLAKSDEDVDVRVTNVAIEDLHTPPYKAVVEFEKVYYTPENRVERRREPYIGHIAFVIRDRVANDLIPINPLGLTITYFRDDQAF